MSRHRSDALHIRRPTEKMQMFNEKVNDKPNKIFYSENLGNHYKCGYPPRPMVEPMHQGHWNTSDDYTNLEEYVEHEKE